VTRRSLDDVARAAGLSDADIQRCRALAEIPEELVKAFYADCEKRKEVPSAQKMLRFYRRSAQRVPARRVTSHRASPAQLDRTVTKTNLDSIVADLRARGFDPRLTPESYESIARCGFRAKTLPLAFVAAGILVAEQPVTPRGLLYRVLSSGFFGHRQPTGKRAKKHSNQLSRITATLRERGVIPFSWLVDNVRQTIKPSSWAALEDFAATVRDAYRRNFWAALPEYVHIFCEKDAMAGVLAPITREYDVALSICRGYSSLSFAHEIAEQWAQIEKPIHAYYHGDHDPSGLDIEADLRDKLARYSRRAFHWTRLAVTPDDFATFDLFPLEAKVKDRRTQAFLAAGHRECAELDAIPAPALRERLEQAILAHIPTAEWERLQIVEHAERESWHAIMAQVGAGNHA